MLRWNSPVDTQRVIENADTSIYLRMVELITLILEHCCFGEDGKAVGETLWDEELQADG